MFRGCIKQAHTLCTQAYAHTLSQECQWERGHALESCICFNWFCRPAPLRVSPSQDTGLSPPLILESLMLCCTSAPISSCVEPASEMVPCQPGASSCDKQAIAALAPYCKLCVFDVLTRQAKQHHPQDTGLPDKFLCVVNVSIVRITPVIKASYVFYVKPYVTANTLQQPGSCGKPAFWCVHARVCCTGLIG